MRGSAEILSYFDSIVQLYKIFHQIVLLSCSELSVLAYFVGYFSYF